VIPAAVDTPMMEPWGTPVHLILSPSAVAETVRTLLLDRSAVMAKMQIVPRLEPTFPR
jgi:hypothetical protein